MTEEEIIELGLRAERLLDSEDYNSLLTKVARDLADDFLSTALEDDKRLQELHLTNQGMQYFTRKLAAYVHLKDDIIAQRNKPSQADDEF